MFPFIFIKILLERNKQTKKISKDEKLRDGKKFIDTQIHYTKYS